MILDEGKKLNLKDYLVRRCIHLADTKLKRKITKKNT
jgi:hypothetical protein